MRNHVCTKKHLKEFPTFLLKTILAFSISPVLSCFVIPTKKVYAAAASVVINELMPNPIGTDSGNEWIELYNPTSVQVSLAGWSLKDRTSTFPLDEFSMDPGAYIVVFPTISLNNTDEEIILTDGHEYIDTLNYSSSVEGISLERINPGCTDLKAHSTSHSKGLTNQNFDQNYCSAEDTRIEIYIREQNASQWSQNTAYFLNTKLAFRSEITSSSGVAKTEWAFDSQTSISEQPVFDTNNVGFRTLELKITLDSQEVIEKNIQIIIEPRILLNEILPDPTGSDSGKEWIELYNPNSFEVSINEWQVKVGNKSQTIENLTIKPKDFAIFNSNNSIPNTSAEILLITTEGLVSDSFQYLETETEKSWARTIDGGGEWRISTVTKSSTNISLPTRDNDTETNKNSSKQTKSEDTIKLELKPPGSYNLQNEITLSSGNEAIKRIEVNKIGFAGFMVSEVGIYLGMVLNKEELARVISFIMRLIKG